MHQGALINAQILHFNSHLVKLWTKIRKKEHPNLKNIVMDHNNTQKSYRLYNNMLMWQNKYVDVFISQLNIYSI